MSDRCVACGEIAEGKPLYKKLGSSDCQTEVFTALHEMQLISLPVHEKNNHFICWDCDETIAEEYATFVKSETKRKADEEKRKKQDEARNIKLQKKLKLAFRKVHEEKLKAKGLTPPTSKYKMKEKQREENRYHASHCFLCKCAFEDTQGRGYQRFSLLKMVDDEYDVAQVLQKLGLHVDGPISEDMKRKRFICCQCYNKIRRNYKFKIKDDMEWSSQDNSSHIPQSQMSEQPKDIFKRRPTAEEHAAEIAKLIPPSLANLYKVVTEDKTANESTSITSKKAKNNSKSVFKSGRSEIKKISASSLSPSDSSSSSDSSDTEKPVESNTADRIQRWSDRIDSKILPTRTNNVNKVFVGISASRTNTIKTFLGKGTDNLQKAGEKWNSQIMGSEVCNLCGIEFHSQPKSFWYTLKSVMPSVAGITVADALQILDSRLADVGPSIRKKQYVCKPCFSRVCTGFRSQILQRIAEKKGIDVNKIEMSKLKVKMIESVQDQPEVKMNGSCVSKTDNKEFAKTTNSQVVSSQLKESHVSTRKHPSIEHVEKKVKKKYKRHKEHHSKPKSRDTYEKDQEIKRNHKFGDSSLKKYYEAALSENIKFKRCQNYSNPKLFGDLELIRLINNSRHLQYKGKVVKLYNVCVNVAKIQEILPSSAFHGQIVRLEYLGEAYQYSNLYRNLKNKVSWALCIFCQKTRVGIKDTTHWLDDPIAPPNLMVPLRWAHLSLGGSSTQIKANIAIEDGKVCVNCYESLRKKFGKFVGSKVALSHGLSSEKEVLNKYKVSFDSVAMNIVADPLESATPTNDNTKKSHREEKTDKIPKAVEYEQVFSEDQKSSQVSVSNSKDKLEDLSKKTLSEQQNAVGVNLEKNGFVAGCSDHQKDDAFDGQQKYVAATNEAQDAKVDFLNSQEKDYSVINRCKDGSATEHRNVGFDTDHQKVDSSANQQKVTSATKQQKSDFLAMNQLKGDSVTDHLDNVSLDLALSDSSESDDDDDAGGDQAKQVVVSSEEVAKDNKSSGSLACPEAEMSHPVSEVKSTCSKEPTKSVTGIECHHDRETGTKNPLLNEKTELQHGTPPRKDSGHVDTNTNLRENNEKGTERSEPVSCNDEIKECDSESRALLHTDEQSSVKTALQSDIANSDSTYKLVTAGETALDKTSVESKLQTLRDTKGKSGALDGCNESQQKTNSTQEARSVMFNSTEAGSEIGSVHRSTDAALQKEAAGVEKEAALLVARTVIAEVESTQGESNDALQKIDIIMSEKTSEDFMSENCTRGSTGHCSKNAELFFCKPLNRINVLSVKGGSELSKGIPVSNLSEADETALKTSFSDSVAQDTIEAVNLAELQNKEEKTISEINLSHLRKVKEVVEEEETSSPESCSASESCCDLSSLVVEEIVPDQKFVNEKKSESCAHESQTVSQGSVANVASSRTVSVCSSDNMTQLQEQTDNQEQRTNYNLSESITVNSTNFEGIRKDTPSASVGMTVSKKRPYDDEHSQMPLELPVKRIRGRKRKRGRNKLNTNINNGSRHLSDLTEQENASPSSIIMDYLNTQRNTIRKLINKSLSEKMSSDTPEDAVKSSAQETADIGAALSSQGSASVSNQISVNKKDSETTERLSREPSEKSDSVNDIRIGNVHHISDDVLGFDSDILEHMGEDMIAPFAQRKKCRGRPPNSSSAEASSSASSSFQSEFENVKQESTSSSIASIWQTLQGISLDDLLTKDIHQPLRRSQYNVGVMLALNDVRVHLGASLEDLVSWLKNLLPLELKEKDLEPCIEKFSEYLLSLSKLNVSLDVSKLKQILPEDLFITLDRGFDSVSSKDLKVSECFVEDVMADSYCQIEKLQWDDFLAPVNLDNLLKGVENRVSWSEFNNGLLYALWRVNQLLHGDDKNFMKWLELTSTAPMRESDYTAMAKAASAIHKHLLKFPEEIKRLVAPIVIKAKTSGREAHSKNTDNYKMCSEVKNSASATGVDISSEIVRRKSSTTNTNVAESTSLQSVRVSEAINRKRNRKRSCDLNLGYVPSKKTARVLPQPSSETSVGRKTPAKSFIAMGTVDATQKTGAVNMAVKRVKHTGSRSQEIVSKKQYDSWTPTEFKSINSSSNSTIDDNGDDPVIVNTSLTDLSLPVISSVTGGIDGVSSMSNMQQSDVIKRLSQNDDIATDTQNRIRQGCHLTTKSVQKIVIQRPIGSHSTPVMLSNINRPTLQNVGSILPQHPILPCSQIPTTPHNSSGVSLIPVISPSGFMTMVPFSLHMPTLPSSVSGASPTLSLSIQGQYHQSDHSAHSEKANIGNSSLVEFDTKESELETKVCNLEKQLNEIQKQNSKLLELNQKLLDQAVLTNKDDSRKTKVDSSVSNDAISHKSDSQSSMNQKVQNDSGKNSEFTSSCASRGRGPVIRGRGHLPKKPKQSFEDALNYSYRPKK